MKYQSLISTSELAQNLEDNNWLIVDCRFSLDDTERGRLSYLKNHIPGAVYAHLDEDLCGPVIKGVTGRHPLPSIDDIIDTFSGWGIDQKIQVVAYDDAGGMIAARLWWMLRWLGHNNVAVLNGGWQCWKGDVFPMQREVKSREARVFVPHLQPELYASTTEVDVMRRDSKFLICDSRAVERYCGENEPIDPVAGHIPGAISTPFEDNLRENGCFLSQDELRNRFKAILGDIPASNTVFYCGSGVTGAHNLLALVFAGLGDARLYAGSWSKWINDKNRPIA